MGEHIEEAVISKMERTALDDKIYQAEFY